MLDKKKIHFWQLAIIFGSITILALINSYINYQGGQAESMGDTMAKMMGMHLENVTVSDLISRQEQVEASAQNTDAQDMSSHHSGTNSYTNAVHLLAIATIVILLPFIIAGTVFLAIIWLE